MLVTKIPADQAVEVIFANGIYYLPQTLRFTSEENRKSVVWRVQEEGKAVLSGGSHLQLEWKPYQNAVMDRSNARDGKWGKELDHNFYAASQEVMNKFAINGCDQNSINGDPHFVDPTKGDFRVSDNSPALKTGFVNFPMDQFGVTSPALKAMAKKPEIPLFIFKLDEPPQKVVQKDYAWMGILLKEPVGQELSAFGVGFNTGGVEMTMVSENSMAARLGFKSNDLIQEVNGTKIKTIQNLKDYLMKNGNEKVHLAVVIRNQTKMTIRIAESLPLVL